MKVALIQMNSQGDKARNLEQARTLIEQAVAEERPDLVALPEIWPLLSDDDAAKRAAAEPVPGGHGLTGMGERVRLYGGRLEVTPGPEEFTVSARLPMEVSS